MNKLKEIRKELRKKDKEWSLKVRERDNFKCFYCGIKKGEIYTNKKGEEKKAIINACHVIPRQNRDFRHDIMNGLSGCVLHHKYSYEFSMHKNPFIFFLWFIKNRKKQYNYLVKKINSKV